MLDNYNRVNVNYTIISEDCSSHVTETFHECHPMRHFSIPELQLFASYSGFDWLTAESFLTGTPPSPKSWGVCVVLQKK